MSESSLRSRRARPVRGARAETRAARGGNKRERILAAAVRVFAKKGFYATRVSEVAKAAGVADGTIYLYFRSKDELLVSLFEDRVERLLVFLESELPRTASASHRLRRIVEVQLGLIEKERDLAEVITVILRQSTKLMKQYAAPKFTAYLDAIARVVADGQSTGELRGDVSPHLAARAIFGALDGITMTWALGKADRGGLVGAAGQIAELVLRGVSSLERAKDAGEAG
ncbi:MAG: TetR/AcrR family transcriptional regulator [Myxococcota bacterium]|nr:TetR/AcrR family transcriptional regulator [Myxococcota bacterium]